MSTADNALPDRIERYFKRVALPRGFREQGLLADLSDEDSLWRAQPDIPPIAWHVAHVAVAEASIILGMSAGKRDEIPEQWLTQYDLGAKIPTAPDDLPPLSAVLPETKRLQESVRAYLCGLSEDAIDAPLAHKPADSRLGFLNTLDDALETLAVHEGHHNGEISLLRRLLGRMGVI